MSSIHRFLVGAAGVTLGCIVSSCTTVATTQYEATALTTYTWRVEYTTDPSDRRRTRTEEFASTSLLNQNGEQADGAVTGPDDQGLWWPELPPRPTAEELEGRKRSLEQIGTPELLKTVEYSLTYTTDGQTRTLPTDHSVYRKAVRARQDGHSLEVLLGVGDATVEDVNPQ
ncbi:hypothetical protein H6F88_07740 [Oculatella sp. FACHB-28]|uniref:hypothetical protein n=1 Tax=Oculatella sp. FACHB-28 TaxID=2692845 RepID=UPI0016864978|nr:hypothetical protein [Oculatella sp. FACHB-28]MBD2055910.1 hypothetical protein [Oculatella sp. FACHB-28]